MRRSTAILWLAISGFVVALLAVIILLVLWNVWIVRDYNTIEQLRTSLRELGQHAPRHPESVRWTVLGGGSLLFTFILVALSLFFSGFLLQRSFRRIQDDWLNMTTHELKLPSANILLFAQTLLRQPLDEPTRRRFLGLIESEALRLDGLVSRILQARRFDTRREPLERKPLELSAWLQRQCEQSRNHFELRAPQRLRVLADEKLLAIALENIVGNARKYGSENEVPEVSLHEEGRWAVIEVADKGLGIPLAWRRRVFQRFERIPDPEHRRRPGTGLGLYIAAMVIRFHDGRIEAIGRSDGPGTRIRLRLPLARR